MVIKCTIFKGVSLLNFHCLQAVQSFISLCTAPVSSGKNRSLTDFFLRVEGGCAQAINLVTVIIFGNSAFTTDELNAYLLFHSLLAVSSDFSPSTESDQEAALLAADPRLDVSEVGRFVLVIKDETGVDQDEKGIEGRVRAVS